MPIPQISESKQKPFEILVDFILFAKENKQIEEYLSDTLEDIIDKMVFDLYFEEISKKHKIYALENLSNIALNYKNQEVNEANMHKLVEELLKCKEYGTHQLIGKRDIEEVALIFQT